MRRSGLPVSVCLIVAWALAFSPAAAAAQDGQTLFAAQCADCHGPRGEGTADVPARLFGDRPTIELADVITRTMPEGSPEDCVGEDAAAIAEWMQQAFYSPEAQARLNPPRISLSRLTVSQYRNAVTDIVSSFHWSAAPNDTQGLDADYYASRNFRREKRVIERVDPRISFQFGTGSPDGEKIAEDQFSATWSGSLIVRETGIYDFTVRSENGVRLYVNNNRSALIDAWVMVGNGLNFTMGRSLQYRKVPHNRLLVALAHGFGHHIETFGNPDFCRDGVLTSLT